MLNGGKVVQYDGKEFKIIYEYDSNYCEIAENNGSGFINILLVKSSDLKEIKN